MAARALVRWSRCGNLIEQARDRARPRPPTRHRDWQAPRSSTYRRNGHARKAADRAGRALLAMLAYLIASLVRRGSAAAVADRSRTQRVGNGNGGRPARGDRRKNLHHQRDQDDRKESL